MSGTMEQHLEKMRLENEKQRLGIIEGTLMGLLIIAGMGVAATLIGYLIVSGMDTELVDALEECGQITVKWDQRGEFDKSVENKSVDECRAKVFEHFKEATP
jgi:hypothetical protein